MPYLLSVADKKLEDTPLLVLTIEIPVVYNLLHKTVPFLETTEELVGPTTYAK